MATGWACIRSALEDGTDREGTQNLVFPSQVRPAQRYQMPLISLTERETCPWLPHTFPRQGLAITTCQPVLPKLPGQALVPARTQHLHPSTISLMPKMSCVPHPLREPRPLVEPDLSYCVYTGSVWEPPTQPAAGTAGAQLGTRHLLGCSPSVGSGLV